MSDLQSAADAFSAFSALAHARRTVKSFTGAPLSRAVITSLLEQARWAPNHRLSQPWRFYCLEQPAIASLGRFLAATPAITSVPDPVTGAAKLAKVLERLPAAGAMVLVSWVRSGDPEIDLEDHAAVAAAVQNLLLAAAAAGVGGYWSTTPALVHPLTARWCGASAGEGVIGMIWLGEPAHIPPPPPRHPLEQHMAWVQAVRL